MLTHADFDPRLRLDLSSGSRSLRGLTDSIDQLHKSEDIKTLPLRSPILDQDKPGSLDYERTIVLMQGRHTQDMHDRHASSLRKICELNAGGFFVHDLGSVETLLTCAVHQLRAGHMLYIGPICELLHTLSLPINKQCSYDETRCSTVIVQHPFPGPPSRRLALVARFPSGMRLSLLRSLGR